MRLPRSNFEGTSAALFQVQIDHHARPSVVFGIWDSFSDFLRDASSKSDDFPAKLEDLASSGIRLVITDKADPDGIGYVQWRVAFYVAGEDAALGNFMCLLDQLISWKAAVRRFRARLVCIAWVWEGAGGRETRRISLRRTWKCTSTRTRQSRPVLATSQDGEWPSKRPGLRSRQSGWSSSWQTAGPGRGDRK